VWLFLLALAGVSFSGSLVRVGDGSISVRLADHRVIDAKLPGTEPLTPSAVAAQYEMGDQVEITCKPIQPVWEADTSRYQSLEVSAIRLVRRPSAEGVAEALEGVPFREGKNLLKRPPTAAAGNGAVSPPDSSPGAGELAHARRINLEYIANLPNFVADETVKRYRSTTKSPRWSYYDTIETEVTFRGKNAVRQRIRRDGKPWDQPYEALPGFKWYEGFGTEISPLFDPRCPTTMEYHGRSKVGGRQLLEYRFSSPVDGCFPFFYLDYQRYNPARTGHVFIDDPGGNVFELDEDAGEFPAEFEFVERDEHVAWDYVKIGDDSHLLPVRASFLVRYNSGTRYRAEVEYKNHRHFEASTNVTFH
jgi:hypothetical protein